MILTFLGRNKSLFDETISVEKFEMTPEQYASRTDTVKAYLQRNKLVGFVNRLNIGLSFKPFCELL
jgi:hypothetical protein